MPMPRLRVFAGPNGSGKSTIKDQIDPRLINIYVNADEIEKGVKATGFLDLAEFNISTDAAELHAFIDTHPLIIKAGLQDWIKLVGLDDRLVDFRAVEINSYYASVLADFIRHKLLDLRVSFTFETVMSSPDKVSFMRMAQGSGYRTYLYFVATDSVEFNINRVKNRVGDGGHPVSEDKIRKRYQGSLELLPAAVAASSRAFIFDNSGDKSIFLAEITDGTDLQFHTDEIPVWFLDAYIDKVIVGPDTSESTSN
ncbi:zeta toxin family protein [Pseudomonas syringae]|nr:zeta toxin family protein [Pseudomonas syringae]